MGRRRRRRLPPAGAGAHAHRPAHSPLSRCSAALTEASLAAEASLRSLSSLLLATRGDAGLVRSACPLRTPPASRHAKHTLPAAQHTNDARLAPCRTAAR